MGIIELVATNLGAPRMTVRERRRQTTLGVAVAPDCRLFGAEPSRESELYGWISSYRT